MLTSNLNGSIDSELIKCIGGERAAISPVEVCWIAGNIHTIKNAIHRVLTGQGSEQTMYYPASGNDIIRPLLAYNVGHLIAVDTQAAIFDKLKTTLDNLGISHEESEEEETIKHLNFELGGQVRKVTYIKGDAGQFSLSTVGLNEVNILHVYKPVGSVSISLNSSNYPMVKDGGFFCFEENRLVPLNVPTLYEIAGLEGIKIVRRNPLTVTTNFGPSKDDIPYLSREGFIYHKVSSVEPKIIQILDEVSKTFYDYDTHELVETPFKYFKNKFGAGISAELVRKEVTSLTDSLKEGLKRFSEVGVDQGKVDTVLQEVEGSFIKSLKDLQDAVRDNLTAYDRASAVYENNQDKGELRGLLHINEKV